MSSPQNFDDQRVIRLKEASGHKAGHDEEMQCLSICHGRTCSGHPRLYLLQGRKDVDARDKRGHDE